MATEWSSGFNAINTPASLVPAASVPPDEVRAVVSKSDQEKLDLALNVCAVNAYRIRLFEGVVYEEMHLTLDVTLIGIVRGRIHKEHNELARDSKRVTATAAQIL